MEKVISKVVGWILIAGAVMCMVYGFKAGEYDRVAEGFMFGVAGGLALWKEDEE